MANEIKQIEEFESQAHYNRAQIHLFLFMKSREPQLDWASYCIKYAPIFQMLAYGCIETNDETDDEFWEKKRNEVRKSLKNV